MNDRAAAAAHNLGQRGLDVPLNQSLLNDKSMTNRVSKLKTLPAHDTSKVGLVTPAGAGL